MRNVKNVISVLVNIFTVLAEKPRLNVYRSLSNIYAQVINDVTGETIVAASTVEKDLKATTAVTLKLLK